MNAGYHGWGPILDISILRREEKHGGRVTNGLHRRKYIALVQIIELRTYETGCGENNIVNRREGCDMKGFLNLIVITTFPTPPLFYAAPLHLVRFASCMCSLHQPFHFLLLLLRRALLDRNRPSRQDQGVKLEIYP